MSERIREQIKLEKAVQADRVRRVRELKREVAAGEARLDELRSKLPKVRIVPRSALTDWDAERVAVDDAAPSNPWRETPNE